MFSEALNSRKELLNLIGTKFDDKVNIAVKLISESVDANKFLFRDIKKSS